MSELTEEDKKWITDNVKETIPPMKPTINPSQEAEYQNSEEMTKKVVAFYLGSIEKYIGGVGVAHKTGKYYDYDYRVERMDKLLHHLEVKTRRNSFGQYEDTAIPLRKYAVALLYLKLRGIKTYFVARFGCGTVAVIDITKEPDRIGVMVRHDRGEDGGEYAYYKVSRMTVIGSIK